MQNDTYDSQFNLTGPRDFTKWPEVNNLVLPEIQPLILRLL